MPKYKAQPNAQISGVRVISTIEALGVFKEAGYKILAENGIANPQPEQWYSQQDFINFFEALSAKVGPATLFMMGKNLGTTAKLPPQMDTFEKVLLSMDQFYKLHHRNVPANEGWRVEKTGATSLKLTSTGPYPDDMLRGVIAGYAEKLKPAKGVIINIKIDPTQPRRDTGGDSVTILVNW